jgi:hypothetical protein
MIFYGFKLTNLIHTNHETLEDFSRSIVDWESLELYDHNTCIQINNKKIYDKKKYKYCH